MYKSKSDLPEALRLDLPEELQDIYLKAYQKSWEEYKEYRGGDAGRESVAHRDAMMAVKQDHVFDEETNKWYPKGEVPEEEEDQGIIDELKEDVKDMVEDL